jgi:hypothetical protein
MSRSYCPLIKVSNSLSPAYTSTRTSLLPTFFSLVHYFGFLLTHSHVALLFCFKVTSSPFFNKGLCQNLRHLSNANNHYHQISHPCDNVYVFSLLFPFYEASICWNICKRVTKWMKNHVDIASQETVLCDKQTNKPLRKKTWNSIVNG